MTRKLFGAIRRKHEINQATLRGGAIPVPSGFPLLNQAFVYSSRLFSAPAVENHIMCSLKMLKKSMAHLLILFVVT